MTPRDAVLAVLNNLQDRRGIKNVLSAIEHEDPDIWKELVDLCERDVAAIAAPATPPDDVDATAHEFIGGSPSFTPPSHKALARAYLARGQRIAELEATEARDDGLLSPEIENHG